jgi:hypothetical protein
VVKVGEGWVEQKLKYLEAGLPNESNILQDSIILFELPRLVSIEFPNLLFFCINFFFETEEQKRETNWNLIPGTNVIKTFSFLNLLICIIS